MLDLIVMTRENIHWALNENLRRVLEEIKHKVPVHGKAILYGDLDFDSQFTVRGVSPNGPRSALSRKPNTRPTDE